MELSVFTPLHATAVWGELTLMRNNNAPRDTLTPYIVDNTFPIYPRRSITGMAEDSSTSLAPCKRINDGDDLNFFLASTAYRDIKIWLLQLNRALFPTKDAHGNISICTLDSPPTYSPVVTSLRSLVTDLENLLTQAPPDTGPRRFGNVAFREWYRLAEERMDSLLEKHIGSTLEQHASDPAVLAELKAYLLGSFGSAQRLDYGTGHELSFLAFLACLSKIDAFAPGEERAIVIGVVQPYIELIRRLILSYTLEPAGSHGVWGLDDHSFAPYIFGSAQLGPPITSPTAPTPLQGSLNSAPEPDTITSKSTVAEQQSSNMYFSAIQFIFDVKKGPFWEHSPILFNISGIKDGWGKINKGMLKMYDAEVLGKFPVVQHFPFGKFFKWERDPDAATPNGPSVHAQQQPSSSSAGVGMNSSIGTAAPWAQQTSNSQSQGGMTSTRAPWANAAAGGAPGTASTAAPWASTTASRMPPPGAGANLPPPTSRGSTYGRMPPPPAARGPGTEAPWKRQDR